MNGYGLGVVRGLLLTLRHAWETYVDDLRWWGRRYFRPEGIAHRRSAEASGIFTIQYPEEKLPVPEEFRTVPFLVFDAREDGGRAIRCTACGICAKVCPPQCIWIVRAKDPETGKPVAQPAEFAIDIDICMNCGSCAEYCPFDAIKMDHDYEMARRTRKGNLVPMDVLLKSASYYESIRPTHARTEDEARAAKAAKVR